ncbi:MAG: dephospho-CoA kinase [Bacillota bacterium]
MKGIDQAVIIGLTGGIASGKSTVARMLEQKGAYLIDADQLAREAVKPNQPAWQEIVNWLGPSILQKDRNINRTKLANLVFNDKAKLDKLNKIVHPWVGQRLICLSEEIRQKDSGAVLVYDIPLLIEAGMQQMVDLVLLVYVPRETQIQRLQERDKLSRAEAENRLKAQMPLDEKKKYADVVIDNRGMFSETARQVDQFWNNLQKKQ